MELQDTLLSDNLVPVSNLRSQLLQKLSKPAVIVTSPPREVKAKNKLARKANSKRGRKARHEKAIGFVIDGATQEQVLLMRDYSPSKMGRVVIHPHPIKPIRNNNQLSSRHLPRLIAGESIIDPDRHPSPDAYDGGYDERKKWEKKRARFVQKAEKTRSKGTRGFVGFSYRLEGKYADGKPF